MVYINGSYQRSGIREMAVRGGNTSKRPAMVVARAVASVHILFGRCRFYSDKPLGERAFQLEIG